MVKKDSKEEVEIHRAIPQIKVIVVGECAREEGKEYVVNSPEGVESLPMIRDLMHSADRETFVCLHLNTKNHLLSWEVVAVGSLNASIVHPRELFKAAILANAASVVLVHNHPSGDPEPSGADLALTKRLVKAGDALGVEVLDHVIFGADACVSLRDRNLM